MRKVREILLLLVDAQGTAREAAGKLLMSILGKNGIKINSRSGGQTCNDRANVKGKCKGVQSQISRLNDQALFVPCAAHNFNLFIMQSSQFGFTLPKEAWHDEQITFASLFLYEKVGEAERDCLSYFQLYGYENTGTLCQHSLPKADVVKAHSGVGWGRGRRGCSRSIRGVPGRNFPEYAGERLQHPEGSSEG